MKLKPYHLFKFIAIVGMFGVFAMVFREYIQAYFVKRVTYFCVNFNVFGEAKAEIVLLSIIFICFILWLNEELKLKKKRSKS